MLYAVNTTGTLVSSPAVISFAKLRVRVNGLFTVKCPLCRHVTSLRHDINSLRHPPTTEEEREGILDRTEVLGEVTRDLSPQAAPAHVTSFQAEAVDDLRIPMLDS